MAYKRKTKDEYEILGLWYGTWELETCEDSILEAKKRLKEYRENQPEVSHKMVIKRIKIKE